MTVFELAIFLGADRAKTPARADFLSELLTGWFGCVIAREDIDRAIANMTARGWLVAAGDRLMPAEEGRRAACPLINGIIGMVDHADAAERRRAINGRGEYRKRGIGSWL